MSVLKLSGDLIAKPNSIQGRGYYIDGWADPSMPDDSGVWRVMTHIKRGLFLWKPSKMRLWTSIYQRGDNCMKGPGLLKRVLKKDPFNANFLDHLLMYPDDIPEECRPDGRTHICFWGTIYSHSAYPSDDPGFVRCLRMERGKLISDTCSINKDFYYYIPAAIRVP